MSKPYPSDTTGDSDPELERQLADLQKESAALASALADEREGRARAEAAFEGERRRLRESLVDALAKVLKRPSRPPSGDGAEPVKRSPSAEPAKPGWMRLLTGRPLVGVSALKEAGIRADVEYLRVAGELDEDWYLEQYPDVADGELGPIEHYVRFGADEGRRPNASFDARTAGKPRPWELPRNPFVLHLKRQARSRFVTGLVSRVLNRGALPKPFRFRDQVTRSPVEGWYGNRRLTLSELLPNVAIEDPGDAIYVAQTRAILSRFLEDQAQPDRESLLLKFGLAAPVESSIASRTPNTEVPRSSDRPSYSIVTPYYAHEEFFHRCAMSVARLCAHDLVATGQRRIEWIIVNDDPRKSSAQIEAMIPDDLRALTRILGDGKNRGIAVRLNEGVVAAQHEWIVLLDCDDMLLSPACSVLDHYIRTFPHCRYISASVVDIDENEDEIRRRRRVAPSAKLFELGNIAGHLVATRRDLFREAGSYDPRFSGCQDYEFALRVAMREPLLQIPEHLYAYRWHEQSQSVGRAARQERIANAVRYSIAKRAVEMSWPDPSRSDPLPLPAAPRGMCIVRTQGKRLELLKEALESIANQTIPVTACVVVHGGVEALEILRRWLGEQSLKAVLLHAPDLARRRGYPLNVALDHLERNAKDFDFFCSLDDDDILYPTFAERLSRTLSLAGADVAFGRTNARDGKGRIASMYPPLPTSCLVAANFIPINAYVVRTATFLSSRIRLREDMHYLEDWDFLLSLLEAGLRFQVLDETLSEFRLIGDGNSPIRQDPTHFDVCQARLSARGLLVATALGPGAFFRDLVDFKMRDRPPLQDAEVDYVYDTMQAFGLDVRRPPRQ